VEFPPEDVTVANGDTRAVPRCSSVSACEAALEDAGFRTATRQVDSDRPAGSFVATSPAAGTRAKLDQVVTIQVSNGSAATEPQPETPAEPAEPAPDGNGRGNRERGPN
jgi:beta-lactam-binding protein with PASTA domain